MHEATPHKSKTPRPDGEEVLSLWLAGDVMTGRGLDQALARSAPPRLYESWVRDARDYVRLAERANGPIPQPLSPAYPWGKVLAELHRVRPQAGLINLETALTVRGHPWPGKGIHYRMHPANIDVLRAAGSPCCALANNHVLDWHQQGLADTLTTLEAQGIAHAGAGRDAMAAQRPCVLHLGLPGGARLLIWSLGLADSGIPRDWAASHNRPGINLLGDLDRDTAALAAAMAGYKRPGDLAVVSIHWGGNWGHAVSKEHRRLVRRLIAAGADLIHGHSSHHPRGMEMVQGVPVLYGCGDLINDYEGIAGHEGFRPELTLLYVARWRHFGAGRSAVWEGMVMTPLRRERFTLVRANCEETAWLANTLNRVSRPPLHVQDDGRLNWAWVRRPAQPNSIS